MSIRAGQSDENQFAKEVWRDALDRLASARTAGEFVADEGDFIAREIDLAYRERALSQENSRHA